MVLEGSLFIEWTNLGFFWSLVALITTGFSDAFHCLSHVLVHSLYVASPADSLACGDDGFCGRGGLGGLNQRSLRSKGGLGGLNQSTQSQISVLAFHSLMIVIDKYVAPPTQTSISPNTNNKKSCYLLLTYLVEFYRHFHYQTIRVF